MADCIGTGCKRDALTKRIAELENEAREQALQALACEGQWIEQTGAQQKRIAELEAQRQWQPIETAPPDSGLYLVQIGNQTHITKYAPMMMSAKWWHPYGMPARLEREPTHWMPLPPPPVERAHGIEEVKR